MSAYNALTWKADHHCGSAECGALVAKSFTGGSRIVTAVPGPYVRLPDHDGIPVYGPARRDRVVGGRRGNSDPLRHRYKTGAVRDLRNPAHGRAVEDLDFETYCPRCGERLRITV